MVASAESPGFITLSKMEMNFNEFETGLREAPEPFFSQAKFAWCLARWDRDAITLRV